ncbi:MAG: hypothetical protein QOH89_2231 [Pseudonocardiales bacterium]|nr:hypothetical protein [Pseudonocardiales bacterium]
MVELSDAVRGWVPVSACLAPVALIGGWTVAAAQQPGNFDPLHQTISALAATGAGDRWIMTAALAILGLCHLATAAGLTAAGRGSRMVLGAGGIATVAVAALPQPNAGHVPAATLGFVALSLWPVGSMRSQRPTRIALTAALLGLLAWLAIALQTGSLIGLAERVLAGAQAFAPLVFCVVTIWNADRLTAARR